MPTIIPLKDYVFRKPTIEETEKSLEEVYITWDVTILPEDEKQEWIGSQINNYFYTPPSWSGCFPYKLRK